MHLYVITLCTYTSGYVLECMNLSIFVGLLNRSEMHFCVNVKSAVIGVIS